VLGLAGGGRILSRGRDPADDPAEAVGSDPAVSLALEDLIERVRYATPSTLNVKANGRDRIPLWPRRATWPTTSPNTDLTIGTVGIRRTYEAPVRPSSPGLSPSLLSAKDNSLIQSPRRH